MAIQVDNEVFNDDLPASISYDPQVQTIGDTMDVRWQAMLPIADQLRVLCNIFAQSEAILDILAFQFQVLFYSGTFNITDPVARLAAKKTLLANNFQFHAHLGTPGTMQDVISTIYQNAIIQEWFAYGGTANHYRILFDNVISGDLQSQISVTQRALKRASQAFDGFFVFNKAPTNLYVAVGVFTQIWQVLPVAIPGRIGDYIVAGASVTAIATVKSSSQRSVIGAGATLSKVVATVILAGATHINIGAHASMTNTARVMRGLAVLIKAGHG